MLHNTFYYGVVHTEGSSNGDKEKRKLQEGIDESQKKAYRYGYRRGMVKAYLDAGYGYLEIADKMGIPESSVRNYAAKSDKYDSMI